MKRLIATTALALVLAAPAYAATEQSLTAVQRMEQGDIYASELIGMRVYATEDDVAGTPYVEGAETEWDDIGEVDDVILTEDGSVKAVVLGIGGFLGIGERDVAIEMDSLHKVRETEDSDDFFLVVTANEDTLMNAPEFERTSADDEMRDVAADDETLDAPADGQMDDMAADGQMEDGAADDQMAADTERVVAPTNNMLVRPMVEREGYREAEMQELTADMLQGARVYGSNDEDVGEIDRLLLDDEGQVTEAVIDVGGFLGIGEHPIAVTLDEIQILRESDGTDVRVFIDSTQSELEKKPAYQS